MWADASKVRRLADEHHLELRTHHWQSLVDAPWWARFDAFRAAWCEANGLMHPVWARRIDQRRARGAGIDMSSSSRDRLPCSPHLLDSTAPNPIETKH